MRKNPLALIFAFVFIDLPGYSAWLVTLVWRRLIISPDPPLPGRGDGAVAREPAQAHL